MGKLKALLKKKARAAVYGTIHVKKTRLQMSRMPLEVSDELMQAHHGETLSLFKFRDTETLSERSMWLPASVTLAELRAQAVKIFSYDRRRVEDVMLSYPEEGIATFDNDGESPLRVLATDHDWTEVGLANALGVSAPFTPTHELALPPPPGCDDSQALKHWNAGAGKRRAANLARLTHQATRNIGFPQKSVDVLAGARLLFNATSVPANLSTLEAMGELKHVEQAATALLSESYESHVGAGAHLHWHLAFISESYRERFGHATRNEAQAELADEALLAAAELEAENIADLISGDKEGAAAALAGARRAVEAADTLVLHSIKESPTTLKLLKVIRLALGMRRRRLTPQAMALRARKTGRPEFLEAVFDEDERSERDLSARMIQAQARTLAARKKVSARRAVRDGVEDESVDGESLSVHTGVSFAVGSPRSPTGQLQAHSPGFHSVDSR